MSRKAELRFRLLSIERMLLRPTSTSAIVQYAREHWGLGKPATLKLIDRVYRRWTIEGEKSRPHEKESQVRRLKMYVGRIADSWDPKKPKEWNLTGLLAVERLLSDVLGTKEPIKVEHDVSKLVAIDSVLASLPAENLMEAVAQVRRDRELANKAKVLLKLEDGSELLGGSVAEAIVRRSGV